MPEPAAFVIEPGPVMQSLTGVRWGRSERTFVLLIPLKGDPIYVLPAFEQRRAREVIGPAGQMRVWEEDESPFALIARIFADWNLTQGRVGIEESVRFFIFDGIRKAAPALEYVSVGRQAIRLPGQPTARDR
jgi:Xaa-Pro dipeptidase